MSAVQLIAEPSHNLARIPGLSQGGSMMKARLSFLRFATVFAAVILPATLALAEPNGNIGIGVSLGANSGLSGYFGVSHGSFIQSVVAMNRYDGYALSVDYAFRDVAFNSSMLDLYYGIGGVIGHSAYYWSIRDRDRWASQDYFGLRIPLGLLFWIPNTPIQIAPEIAPTVVFGPSTFVTIDPSLALRLVF
jgi:hypothetical protein